MGRERERGYYVERISMIKWDYKTEPCDYNRHRGEHIVMKERRKTLRLLPEVVCECFLFEEN